MNSKVLAHPSKTSITVIRQVMIIFTLHIKAKRIKVHGLDDQVLWDAVSDHITT